ncbi:spore coat protein CotJB [Paenibacillus radicis (ex Gao et al. 2016)]|uniref:Spore coat protein CotJB n=1 Tax=Paenibacillus radicis (ex Gao et al. 2016) TaxID=1737354 RepID=A0A917GS18_9BACL|nr:spore coat protein CotJB [Paenibacillus radicis (ex Gao et al. 2016)]GGG54787.1 spore coat protein CotJB [Paenibacillus radicis (ex Gao et al. 2016)]
MSKTMDSEFYKLLHELQAIDFVLVELNLYLDTHPNDVNAIQQYNHCAQVRQQIAHHYEARYGPLKNFGQSYSGTPFQWVDTPWPWQV